MKENEIIIFEAEDKSITLPVSVKNDTVWLSANMIAGIKSGRKGNDDQRDHELYGLKYFLFITDFLQKFSFIIR